MTAKPTAVVVPLVIWILDYWLIKEPLRRTARSLIGWVLLAFPIIVLTKLDQPNAMIDFVPSLFGRLIVAGDALSFYLYKLIFPLSLAPDYGRSPAFLLEQGWAYLTGILPFVAVTILLLKKTKPWLLASVGLFFAGLLSVSGLIPFNFQNISTVTDRYVYFSMSGLALGVGYVVSFYRRQYTILVCVLILTLLGLRTFLQMPHWKNANSLWNHALLVNPNSWLAHINLANVLAEKNELDKAKSHYYEALRLKPNYAEAHNNLSYCQVLWMSHAHPS